MIIEFDNITARVTSECRADKQAFKALRQATKVLASLTLMNGGNINPVKLPVKQAPKRVARNSR